MVVLAPKLQPQVESSSSPEAKKVQPEVRIPRNLDSPEWAKYAGFVDA
jgi:hypothetical protein